MATHEDRINWLLEKQESWKYVPNLFPTSKEGQKVLRNLAQEMVNAGLYKSHPSVLEVSVYNLIKKCRIRKH